MEVEKIGNPEEKKSTQKTKHFKILHFKRMKFPSNEHEIQIGEDMNPVLADIVKNKPKLEELVAKKCGQKDETISDIANYSLITSLEFYVKNHDSRFPPVDNDEKCCICMFEFFEDINKMSYKQLFDDLAENKDEDIIELEKCSGHYFHIGCLKSYIAQQTANYIRCPICTFIYGIMTGDQPQGTMKTSVQKKLHCDGYEDCGTIVIEYNFPSGTLPDGKRYWGTSRVAYLPDNEDGREVLRLLKTSFERRLTFTVGTSVTTGRADSVIWNGIHHKTNTDGGPTSFGYPDETYFNRVKLELAAKGVL